MEKLGEKVDLEKYILPLTFLTKKRIAWFSSVLSFNYTNTYERFYGNKKTKYCYIHGKAQDDRTKTNLIFGIDDNLKQGQENQNFEWARFKKYFQRIILKTGSEYKDWLLPDPNNKNSINYAYIVGHSLE